jgi:transposase
VLEETHDDHEIIARVAALDIGKAELVCCVRVPGENGSTRRVQEVVTYSTMTRSLQVMVDRLLGLGVTRVVMEATSDYWKSPFYLFEAHGLDVWLVNAKDVKHLPGRPKTDRLDAVWLCKIAERQMIRASFVPPKPIRRLRDLTRYRVALVTDASAEKNRVEKLLEDAQIKLSVVASDIFGVSGRDMMNALINGQRDPAELAQLARRRMRVKTPSSKKRSTASSPITTRSCSPACWTASTRSAPTSPRSRPGSRPRSPLSLTRWPAWIRSPVSVPPQPT